jgi:hypothetical protein
MGRHGTYGTYGHATSFGAPTVSKDIAKARESRAASAQGRDASMDKVAKAAQKALASSAATTAFVATFPAVASTLGISAGAATTAGTGLVTALLGGTAGSATVPVAGWIVAGVLAGTAATITIVRAARKGKRGEFRKIAEKYGGKGIRFGRQYERFAKRSPTANTKTVQKLDKQLRNVSQALRKKPKSKTLQKKLVNTASELQAASLVLATQVQPAARKSPMIAGEPKTAPEVAEEAIPTEYYVAGGLVLGTLLLAAAKGRR